MAASAPGLTCDVTDVKLLLLSVGIHTTLLTCWLLLSKQQQLQVIIIIVIATFLSILSSYLQDFLIVWFHFGRWEPGFQDNSLIMIITDNTVSVFCSITDRTDIFLLVNVTVWNRNIKIKSYSVLEDDDVRFGFNYFLTLFFLNGSYIWCEESKLHMNTAAAAERRVSSHEGRDDPASD